MDAEAQRLLRDFATNLNRTVPQPEPAEWPRRYEFIIHVTRRQAPSAEAVGHPLVQAGLDWEGSSPTSSSTGMLSSSYGERKKRTRERRPRVGRRRRSGLLSGGGEIGDSIRIGTSSFTSR